jgi:hypothetical protein
LVDACINLVEFHGVVGLAKEHPPRLSISRTGPQRVYPLLRLLFICLYRQVRPAAEVLWGSGRG